MTQNSCVFYLKVQRVEQACLFELSWGRGQQIGITLPYPQNLTTLYQEWSAIYLSFYKQALRGRVSRIGNLAAPPVDWHAKLVQAEAKLLYEFHQWLRQAELFEIRSRIAQAARDASPTIEVFLTCNPLEVARLPWEAWEIGTEFAAAGRIRIVRTPLRIQGLPVTPKIQRRRARILAILGDDTGLNFQADRDAVRSLAAVADIQFIGWQPGQDIDALKAEIVNTIVDERGWDVLFFAGHSNETVLTGGELAIAPGVSLNLNELTQPLTTAKERGLQFALFNSCNGLSLANALIDLGLSQVAVMREPIHNQVAQEFLVQFLQHLAQHQDVHESLIAACQYLKLEKHLTYPSAYLIPSLFRHPDAQPFILKPFGLKEQLQRWIPTKQEAIALAILGLVSWQLSVQTFLLERRVLVQAMYRHLTGQVADRPEPPLLLVQIDDQSIIEAGIKDPTPMDRDYLASLVDQLSALDAKVVGIDYLLDRPHGESDRILAQSLQTAVQDQQTWFVFPAIRDDANQWVGVLPDIASLGWTWQGDMNLFIWRQRLGYMKLVPVKDESSRNLPLAYLMALAHRLNSDPTYAPPQPELSSPKDYLSQVTDYLNRQHQQDYTTWFSPRTRLHPVTNFAYGLGQMWLHPIIDFSIPPNQVYSRIPAWTFLQLTADSPPLQNLDQQAVMIVAGGYGKNPGTQMEGEDVFPLPDAVGYWRNLPDFQDPRRFFTGGEAHAYMIHNYLNQRLVIPIPDLWMILMAALLGKGTTLALQQRQRRFRQWGAVVLVMITAFYGLASLQIYIWRAILLPWLLPSVMFWVYGLTVLIRKRS